MPRRVSPIITGEIYHIFNRSVGAIPIFENIYDYGRFANLIDYYRFESPCIRFSHFIRLEKGSRNLVIKNIRKSNKLVDVHAMCLMPNHFHLLLKQFKNNGISLMITNLQNSYARYFNTKYDRSGTLFQNMFKAKHIENDEHFLHVQRYTHINPLTSFVIKDKSELFKYKWSSFSTFTTSEEKRYDYVNTDFGLKLFSGSKKRLERFTLDQVDYQRSLKLIKHLVK